MIMNLKLEEAAKFLCVSTSKLYKMTHRKEIKYYKMGRLDVFNIEDLKLYMESKAVLTKEELRTQGRTRIIDSNKK